MLLKHILDSRCEEPRPEPRSNDASAPAPRLLPLRSRCPRYISPRRVHRHRARTACSASGLTFVVPRASSNARLHASSSSSVTPSVNSMSDCLVPIGPFESSVRVFDSAPPIRPRTTDGIYILSCVTTNTVEHLECSNVRRFFILLFKIILECVRCCIDHENLEIIVSYLTRKFSLGCPGKSKHVPIKKTQVDFQ